MARDRTLGLRLKAIDKMSTAIDRVQSKFPKLTRSIQRASATSKIFNAQTKQMRANLDKIGGKLQGIGRAMTVGVTLPVAAAGAASVKLFADFEQGLKGVEKTTGITGPAIEKLGKRFDQLSTEIPVSTAEMLELAQAGGQLGIKGADNIEKFTTTMAKLSRASDVAGEDGAKAIARILTVTGSGIKTVDQFSSALVDLGNNAAAGEQEILGVATRVAGQIGRFDVAADKVLGISTALKALGKNAEAGGSVVGRAFDAIDQAIKSGGDEMKLLSKVTGIATKDLKKQFATDAAAVFQKFIFGLNKVQTGGGNLIQTMDDLGLKGVRINDILGTLSKQPQVLAENMERAARAFKENTALEEEFRIQTQTLQSALLVISNTFKSLLTLIGAELAPAVAFFGKIFKRVLDFLRENPVIRRIVIVFAALAAVMGPILLAFGAFLTILPGLIGGIAALSAASLPITGTFLLIGAAIAAVIAISIALVTKWEEIKAFFNENPFGQVIKFLFSVLNPIGQVISAVRLLLSAFRGLDALKSTVKDILPSFIGDAIFGKETLGAEKGALKPGEGVLAKKEQTKVGGVIDVNFLGAPAGTNVKAKTQGPLDFNLGLAGGIQ